MRRSTIAIALFVAALVLSNVKPGFACQGDKVLLAEDFSTADASWGAQNENFSIKDGAATIKPDSQRG
ncbi:MAG: hypothetical protein WBE90_24295, partial [Xanthobacteraceae bacterium]